MSVYGYVSGSFCKNIILAMFIVVFKVTFGSVLRYGAKQ